MLTYTLPLLVTNISRTALPGYLVVETSEGHILKCKLKHLSGPSLAAMLEAVQDYADGNYVFRFGAFKPWNPYSWFVEMKKVEFKPRSVRVWSPFGFADKELIHNAIKYFMNFYSINDIESNDAVIVSFYPDVFNSRKAALHNRINNNSYIAISIDDKMTNNINSLFHELIHFKQYATKQMDKWNNTSLATWDNTPYRELPWEVEAWAMADELTKRFMQQELTRRGVI